MDILIIIVAIIALVSAIAFNWQIPQVDATSEWNPLAMFFQGQLGWDIFQSTAFCGGILIVAVLIWIAVGKETGLSKGMWHNQPAFDERFPQEDHPESVKGDLLKTALAIIVLAVIVSLCKVLSG